MRGNPFPLHHELSVQIKVVGNRKKLKVGLGSLTPPPKISWLEEESISEKGSGFRSEDLEGLISPQVACPPMPTSLG